MPDRNQYLSHDPKDIKRYKAAVYEHEEEEEDAYDHSDVAGYATTAAISEFKKMWESHIGAGWSLEHLIAEDLDQAIQNLTEWRQRLLARAGLAEPKEQA